MKRTKGFTLLELLIVIAIISILCSVVLSGLRNAREKGCTLDATNKSEFCVKYRKENKVVTNVPVETNETKTIDERVEEEIGNPETWCDNIPDAESRKECQDQQYSAKMIQNCIDRYEYKGPSYTN